MGADLTARDNQVEIRGVPYLSGAVVEATDLRAGAALVTAGLAAREPPMYVEQTHLTGDMNGWISPFSFWAGRFNAIMEKWPFCFLIGSSTYCAAAWDFVDTVRRSGTCDNIG